jgi:5-methyltetrahydropteroyltriglutamate--homocysteine methyltransferase
MSIHVSLTGGFPRTRSYARTVSMYLKKKIKREDLYKEAVKQSLKIARILVENGTDVLNDLMYLTDDLLNPFQKDLVNTETGWLVRFYENNNFVRNVVVKGPISLKENYSSIKERINLIEELRKNVCQDCVYRLPVPGPLTLFHFSHFETSYPAKKYLSDYVNNVLDPLEKILAKKSVVLEIHEPSLAYHGRKMPRYYPSLYENLDNSHFLLTYFGSISKNVAEKLSRKMIVGYDLIEGKREVSRSAKVQLGIIDSRNTRIEDPRRIAELVKKFESLEEVYISTNAPLEFLPEKIAYRKMKLLGRIKKLLGGA